LETGGIAFGPKSQLKDPVVEVLLMVTASLKQIVSGREKLAVGGPTLILLVITVAQPALFVAVKVTSKLPSSV